MDVGEYAIQDHGSPHLFKKGGTWDLRGGNFSLFVVLYDQRKLSWIVA
jgi:hypothetical protein